MGVSRWWNTIIEGETVAERHERLEGVAEKLADIIYLGRNLCIGFSERDEIEILLGERGIVRQKLDARSRETGEAVGEVLVVLRDVGKMDMEQEQAVKKARVVVVMDREVLTKTERWVRLGEVVHKDAQLVLCTEKGGVIPPWERTLYKLSARWNPVVYEL